MKNANATGKYAIITGATCGIGAAFAKVFAENGYHLLITGRRAKKLFAFARELRRKNGILVLPVILELANDRDVHLLLKAINRIPVVEVLINNAGFGCQDPFFEDAYSNQEKMLKVHIDATCRITHHTVPRLIQNQGGTIINVCSLAAYTPLINNYFYSATKAFLTTFSECLHLGLMDKNIRVQALCPGFTKTEFHTNLQAPGTDQKGFLKHFWMTSEEVVAKSIRALKKRQKVIYIPGFINQLILLVIRLMPRSVYYRIAKNFLSGK